MRYLVNIILSTVALAVWTSNFGLKLKTHADASTPSLTEIHAMRLQLDQKDALIAQATLQQAQQAFQNSINKFNSDCAEFKKSDHVPEAWKCDIGTATIKEPDKK